MSHTSSLSPIQPHLKPTTVTKATDFAAGHPGRRQWLRRWSPRLAEPGDHAPGVDPLPAKMGFFWTPLGDF